MYKDTLSLAFFLIYLSFLFFHAQNCNLTGCDLQDANLRGANITGATIAEITGPLHMTAFVRNQLPGSLSVSSSPDE